MTKQEKYKLAHPEKVKAIEKKYKAKHRDMVNRALKKWKLLNPEKNRAQQTVYRAVKSGKIAKPGICQACGAESPVEGHHFDYYKPLDVVWLCHQCHVIKTHGVKP